VSLDDPELVRAAYASEAGLVARASIYRFAEGPDPHEVAFAAVAEAKPERVLEVGGGTGEFAERMVRELGVEVVFLDVSPRMVELARARGLDARVGDVQELPFSDCCFDCAAAAWMLFHVADLDRGLAELARVLCPGGRLVAVTNSITHLQELRERLPGLAGLESAFSRENGAQALGRHFRRVERRDADGWVTFPDEETVRSYVGSMISHVGPVDDLPAIGTPLRARRAPSVFVAEK
jgi:SAM-dependent methyltransferase